VSDSLEMNNLNESDVQHGQATLMYNRTQQKFLKESKTNLESDLLLKKQKSTASLTSNKPKEGGKRREIRFNKSKKLDSMQLPETRTQDQRNCFKKKTSLLSENTYIGSDGIPEGKLELFKNLQIKSESIYFLINIMNSRIVHH